MSMHRKRRVLVVDDNETNLAIVEEMLEVYYDVQTALTGERAISVARRIRPHAILLDVMMPGMDGCETCRKLRAIPETRDSFILMVSAKAMPSEQQAGLQAGADDYITKPFDDGELLAKLRTVLPASPYE
jgi:CheY-like chemotaxis protein